MKSTGSNEARYKKESKYLGSIAMTQVHSNDQQEFVTDKFNEMVRVVNGLPVLLLITGKSITVLKESGSSIKMVHYFTDIISCICLPATKLFAYITRSITVDGRKVVQGHIFKTKRSSHSKELLTCLSTFFNMDSTRPMTRQDIDIENNDSNENPIDHYGIEIRHTNVKRKRWAKDEIARGHQYAFHAQQALERISNEEDELSEASHQQNQMGLTDEQKLITNSTSTSIINTNEEKATINLMENDNIKTLKETTLMLIANTFNLSPADNYEQKTEVISLSETITESDITEENINALTEANPESEIMLIEDCKSTNDVSYIDTIQTVDFSSSIDSIRPTECNSLTDIKMEDISPIKGDSRQTINGNSITHTGITCSIPQIDIEQEIDVSISDDLIEVNTDDSFTEIEQNITSLPTEKQPTVDTLVIDTENPVDQVLSCDETLLTDIKTVNISPYGDNCEETINAFPLMYATTDSMIQTDTENTADISKSDDHGIETSTNGHLTDMQQSNQILPMEDNPIYNTKQIIDLDSPKDNLPMVNNYPSSDVKTVDTSTTDGFSCIDFENEKHSIETNNNLPQTDIQQPIEILSNEEFKGTTSDIISYDTKETVNHTLSKSDGAQPTNATSTDVEPTKAISPHCCAETPKKVPQPNINQVLDESSATNSEEVTNVTLSDIVQTERTGINDIYPDILLTMEQMIEDVLSNDNSKQNQSTHIMDLKQTTDIQSIEECEEANIDNSHITGLRQTVVVSLSDLIDTPLEVQSKQTIEGINLMNTERHVSSKHEGTQSTQNVPLMNIKETNYVSSTCDNILTDNAYPDDIVEIINDELLPDVYENTSNNSNVDINENVTTNTNYTKEIADVN